MRGEAGGGLRENRGGQGANPQIHLLKKPRNVSYGIPRMIPNWGKSPRDRESRSAFV
ncbi:MAG: hypothetical protein CM15mP74_03150 [Halieaceae bacterium]|nr:MAG: hypothetical protein CM15mP74_03150 [Halieaceae bacterium]